MANLTFLPPTTDLMVVQVRQLAADWPHFDSVGVHTFRAPQGLGCLIGCALSELGVPDEFFDSLAPDGRTYNHTSIGDFLPELFGWERNDSVIWLSMVELFALYARWGEAVRQADHWSRLPALEVI